MRQSQIQKSTKTTKTDKNSESQKLRLELKSNETSLNPKQNILKAKQFCFEITRVIYSTELRTEQVLKFGLFQNRIHYSESDFIYKLTENPEGEIIVNLVLKQS